MRPEDADPSWYLRVLQTLARDYPKISEKVWGTAVTENAQEMTKGRRPDDLAFYCSFCGTRTDAVNGEAYGMLVLQHLACIRSTDTGHDSVTGSSAAPDPE